MFIDFGGGLLNLANVVTIRPVGLNEQAEIHAYHVMQDPNVPNFEKEVFVNEDDRDKRFREIEILLQRKGFLQAS